MINLNYLNLLCFYFVCVSCLDLGLPFQKSYKVRLISLEKCKVPSHLRDKDVNIDYHVQARKANRKTTMIRITFSVPYRVGPIAVTFKGYQLQQNSARDLLYKFENLKCDHVLPKEIIRVLKMKMDKNCFALPNSYDVNNINLDDYSNIMTTTVVRPGKYAYDIEVFTPKGIVACVTLTCDMSPGKRN